MPVPLTNSCFSKIQIGFTSLLPADLSSPGQRAVKCVYVRACVVSFSCVPRSRLSLDFTFCNPLANELWSAGTVGTAYLATFKSRSFAFWLVYFSYFYPFYLL